MNKEQVLWCFCAAVLLLTTTTQLHAAFGSSSKGTTTASFLKLGVGARAIGMGEAYSAVADEASALYWNPAGLKQISGGSLLLMHSVYLEESFLDYAAYGHNLGNAGAVGLGVQYLSAGKITETDLSGTTLGSFTPNDLAISLGYANTIAGFKLGISGKFIQSKIIDSASALAADLGIISPSMFQEKFKLSFTTTNLGTQMKFESEKEDLPLALRLGSALKITEHWQWGLDMAFPKDNDPYQAIGTEYQIPITQSMTTALRAGYNTRTLGDLTGTTGLAGGIGLTYQKLSLDYAIVPFGSLGLTHRISLSFKF